MKRFSLFIVFIAYLFTLQISLAAQIEYDSFGTNALGERHGNVYLNGNRYNVTVKENSLGGSQMEISNYDRRYKGTIDSYGYGTLRDFDGNKIKVRPY